MNIHYQKEASASVLKVKIEDNSSIWVVYALFHSVIIITLQAGET